MSHDIVITGGTIVDGTGAEPYTGDVAIDGDRITAVGTVDGAAKRTIDAAGAIVTPGFVDIHTHYDGQATWDTLMAPSSWHGVTTVDHGQLRRRLRPVPPRRPRPADRADGGRRGHPRRGAARGPRLAVGELPRVPRRARPPPPRHRRRRPAAPRRAAPVRDGRARRRPRGRHRRRHRRHGPHRRRGDGGRGDRLRHLAHPQPPQQQRRADADAHRHRRRAGRHRQRDERQGRAAGGQRLLRPRRRDGHDPRHGRGVRPAAVDLASPRTTARPTRTARCSPRSATPTPAACR